MMRRNRRGLTLVEMVVVVLILGISISVFYVTFGTNWAIFDNYITRADLWQEMDAIIDQASIDARSASQIITTEAGGVKTVTFIRPDAPNVVYSMANTGVLLRNEGGGPVTLSTHVVYENSNFLTGSDGNPPPGRALRLSLELADNLVHTRARINAQTEVYPRN